eukprot:3358235-Amphidinium_carterae.1
MRNVVEPPLLLANITIYRIDAAVYCRCIHLSFERGELCPERAHTEQKTGSGSGCGHDDFG